jgi:hypothetical protein
MRFPIAGQHVWGDSQRLEHRPFTPAGGLQQSLGLMQRESRTSRALQPERQLEEDRGKCLDPPRGRLRR